MSDVVDRTDDLSPDPTPDPASPGASDEAGADSSEPGVDASAAKPSTGVRLLLLAAIAIALGVAIAVIAVSSEGPGTVEIVVPAGTGGQLAAGEVVEVVPPVIRVEPGGAVEVDNEDVRLHVLGALRADAGETARLAFAQEGRYVLPTSLRSDGQVTVLVEDPDRAEP
jgi:hypothetical protein